MPRIEATHSQPRVVNDENVAIDLQTSLYLDEDGKVKGNIRAPFISFEARSALAHAMGVSSEAGFCEIKGLVIDNGTPDLTEGKKATISITATYSEGDENKNVIEDIEVDISEQVRELLGIKKAKQDKEEAQRQRAQNEAQRNAAEDAKKRMAREMYEALEPERKRQIKAQITEAGRRVLSTEAFQIAPFNTFREFADHPHTLDTVRMVAKQSPKRFMDGVNIFKSTDWADEVMRIAAQELPEHVVPIVDSFEDMGCALDMLKIAAKRYPTDVINALPKYCQRPWCRDLMLHLAASAPQAVFETAEMWEFYPWAKEVALEAASKAPEFVARHYPLYQHQPWAKEVYEKATSLDSNSSAEHAEFQRLLKKEIGDKAKAIADNDPNNVNNFAFLYEHRHHPHARTMMLDVAKNKSKACIIAIGIFKSAPWARDAMVCAAEVLPAAIISEVESYIEMPWADEPLKIAARKDKNHAASVVRALPKYAAKSWAKSVELDIAKTHPDVILEEIEFIEYQSWAEGVVFEASKSDLNKALNVLRNHQDRPWASPLVRKIEKLQEEERRAVSENHKRLEREKVNGALQLKKTQLAPDKFVEWLMQQHNLPLDDDQIHYIIEEIERNFPGTAVYTYHHYKEKSWSTSVLIGALRNDPKRFCNIRWESIDADNIQLLAFYKDHKDQIFFDKGAIIICLSAAKCESFLTFLCRGNPQFLMPLLNYAASEQLVTRLATECSNALSKDRRDAAVAERSASDIVREWKANVERQKTMALEAVADEESKKSRRRFLGTIGDLAKVALIGGLGYGGYKWYKSPDYKANLKDVNLDQIGEDPEKILPDDIGSWLTPKNLAEFLGALGIQYIFQKKSDGTYKYNVPDVYNLLSSMGRNKFGGVLDNYTVERTGDGLVTIQLGLTPYYTTEGYTTGLLFKDYHPGRIEPENDKKIEFPHWMVIEVNTQNMKVDWVSCKDDNSASDDNNIRHRVFNDANWCQKEILTTQCEGKITVKQCDSWPIAETVKFKLEDGQWSLDHTAEIHYGFMRSYTSKVVHTAKEQAEVREKRRKRKVEKALK